MRTRFFIAVATACLGVLSFAGFWKLGDHHASRRVVPFTWSETASYALFGLGISCALIALIYFMPPEGQLEKRFHVFFAWTLGLALALSLLPYLATVALNQSDHFEFTLFEALQGALWLISWLRMRMQRNKRATSLNI